MAISSVYCAIASRERPFGTGWDTEAIAPIMNGHLFPKQKQGYCRLHYGQVIPLKEDLENKEYGFRFAGSMRTLDTFREREKRRFLMMEGQFSSTHSASLAWRRTPWMSPRPVSPFFPQTEKCLWLASRALLNHRVPPRRSAGCIAVFYSRRCQLTHFRKRWHPNVW